MTSSGNNIGDFLRINLPNFMHAYRYDRFQEGSDCMIFTRRKKCRYGVPSHTVPLGALLISICCQESASVHELAVLALDSADSGWTPSDGQKPDLAQFVVDLLVSKADMLADYFSLQISQVSAHFQFHFHFCLDISCAK